MRCEYLVRFADGKRYTIAFQEQLNHETVYVDRYSGQVLPAACLVRQLDRPEWSGEIACSATEDRSVALVRAAVLLKLAAYRALNRASAMFHLPQRGVAAFAGGRPGATGLSLNS